MALDMPAGCDCFTHDIYFALPVDNAGRLPRTKLKYKDQGLLGKVEGQQGAI